MHSQQVKSIFKIRLNLVAQFRILNEFGQKMSWLAPIKKHNLLNFDLYHVSFHYLESIFTKKSLTQFTPKMLFSIL